MKPETLLACLQRAGKQQASLQTLQTLNSLNPKPFKPETLQTQNPSTPKPF